MVFIMVLTLSIFSLRSPRLEFPERVGKGFFFLVDRKTPISRRRKSFSETSPLQFQRSERSSLLQEGRVSSAEHLCKSVTRRCPQGLTALRGHLNRCM